MTALDHAPAMLAVPRHKLEAERGTNITIVEAAWATAAVVPHDVVLATWALY